MMIRGSINPKGKEPAWKQLIIFFPEYYLLVVPFFLGLASFLTRRA